MIQNNQTKKTKWWEMYHLINKKIKMVGMYHLINYEKFKKY